MEWNDLESPKIQGVTKPREAGRWFCETLCKVDNAGLDKTGVYWILQVMQKLSTRSTSFAVEPTCLILRLEVGQCTF